MQGYGVSVDWWSLGVLVHEMVTGVTPWRHDNIYTLYDMIIDIDFDWSEQHSMGKFFLIFSCDSELATSIFCLFVCPLT